MRLMIFSLVLFLLAACSSSSSAPCKYGSPKAIFSKELAGIKDHKFTSTDSKSTETIRFKDTPVELTIYQSGCEAIVQEFQFLLYTDLRTKTPEYWVEQAIEQFQFLSSFGDKYLVLYTWGQAIAEAKANMKIGEAHEVQPNFWVTINKVESEHHPTLIVTLAQQQTQ